MDNQTDKPGTIDDCITTMCFGLWQVIKFAQEAHAAHGPGLVQALADRIMQTPYPIEDAERCQYIMIKELTTTLARTGRSKPQ